MAGRDIRRKPGMTVGQRMRDFSRTVMRHYAPLPDDSTPSSAPASLPAEPSSTPPVASPEVNPQFIASPPLPFDTPAADNPAPLLPPADLPVYAPDPPLPQYVVPSTPPTPVVQRTEQPARPAGDIAMGPDGKPLIYNGKPVPVDPNPTPPALLELMQRQRQRDSEVQRLKEERTEQLKAELPPQPEDSDAPRSSRIRRRGSADVDYIQTKALADKREPGDNGAPPAKNVKSPREPEQQEAQTLDDDEESNGDGAESASFDPPVDAASPVIQPADTPAIQRETDFATPVTSIPFDTPIDIAPAEPDAIPETLDPEQPSSEPQSPVPADVPPAPAMAIQRQPEIEALDSPRPLVDAGTEKSSNPVQRPVMQDLPQLTPAPQASTPAVQRDADTNAPNAPLPVSESIAAQDNKGPAVHPLAQQAPQIQRDTPVQTTPQIVYQTPPDTTPTLPFDAPTIRPGLPDESQTQITPAPEIPAVQREIDPEVVAPSLPFDAPMIEQPHMPEVARPLTDGTPEASLSPVAAPPSSSPAIQRQPDTDGFTPQLPFDTPVADQVVFPALDQPEAKALPDAAQSPVNAMPQTPVQTVQRSPNDAMPSLPTAETPSAQLPARETDSPVTPEILQAQRVAAPIPAQSAATSPVPTIQRQLEAESFMPEALPFDAPSVEQAASPEFSQPEQIGAPQAAAPMDAPPSQSIPTIQRRTEADAPALDALPFDAPSVEQDAPPEFSQPQQAATSQVPALMDAPLSQSAPAIQRQAQADPPAPVVLPFDAPSAEQATYPEFSQSEQTATPQAPAPTDVPLSQNAPAIQPQPEVDAPALDALPFDAPSVEQAASPEFSQPEQALAPQTPAAIDTPSSQTIPAIQRQPEVDAPVSDALPFEVPSLEQGSVAEVAQTQIDVSPSQEISAPSVQREAEVEAPAPRAIPFDAPSSDPSPAAERAAPTARQDARPSIQRQIEAESPVLNALPFDAPLETQESSLDVPPPARSTSQNAPVQADVLPSEAAPAIQRQAEAQEPTSSELPFDEQPPAKDAPSEGTQSQTDTLATQQTSSPTVQRRSDVEIPAADGLPFDATVAERPAVQPAAQSMTQILQTQQVGTAQPSLVTAAVQREVDAETAAPQDDTPVAPAQRRTEPEFMPQVLPLDAPQVRPDAASASRQPEPTNVSNVAPHTATPTIQRSGSEVPASPLPFDIAQPDVTTAALVEQTALSDGPYSDQLLATQTPQSVPPTPVSDIQRHIAPDLPITSVPSDVQLARQPEVLPTRHEAAQDIAVPDQTGMPHALPSATVPVVQRQTAPPVDAPLPFEVTADAPVIDHAVTPSAAQRQVDIPASMPVPTVTQSVPAALPFDDLEAMTVQRSPEPAAQVPQPAILPFDPVSLPDSANVQRTATPEPIDPFSTPHSMPASAAPESRMDVFQALVAAGMVSRPPGGTAMPATALRAQPLLQRSPSREAYLANMAQQQESAGAVSGPIQRALSADAEASSSVSEPQQDEAPEIDVNQLASDVMRVLRDKLRSEHERLSKR